MPPSRRVDSSNSLPASPAGPPVEKDGSRQAPAGWSGSVLVLGLLLLGLGAAVTGIWFQWGQTRRCLEFYGPRVARLIAEAPRVELWTLEPGSSPRHLRGLDRQDVSQAPGLVHLRRGLVEDANFRWEEVGNKTAPLPVAAWDSALMFATPEDGDSFAVLAIDFAEDGGALTVVGQPGRIGLGRLERGLQKWLETAR